MPYLYSRGKGAKPKQDDRHQESRSATPLRSETTTESIPRDEPHVAAYTLLDLDRLVPSTTFRNDGRLSKIIENPVVPEARALKEIQSELRSLVDRVGLRSEEYNRGIRQLAANRKELEQDVRSNEYKDRAHTKHDRRNVSVGRDRRPEVPDSEDPDAMHDVTASQADDVRATDTSGADGDVLRPPTHGERRVTEGELQRGDAEMLDAPMGSLGPPAFPDPSSASVIPDLTLSSSELAANISQADASKSHPSESSVDSDYGERQPIPSEATYQLEQFDPISESDDEEFVYHIQPILEEMSEDEIKRIYEVSEYPHDDLQHLLPGPPPNSSFVNAKPNNQVMVNTWITFIDAYFRPFGDEDLAFLRDRGDRVSPFLIPRRDPRKYQEIWAEEDGISSMNGTALTNGSSASARENGQRQYPKGSVEDLSDATAETDQVSSGPLLARLLSCLRPEVEAHKDPPDQLTNGHYTHADPSSDDLFHNDRYTDGTSAAAAPAADAMDLDDPAPPPPPPPPPPSSTSFFLDPGPAKALNPPRLDYQQIEERLKQELRHIGVLPEEGEPDYGAHEDDEIAGRLRLLQVRLRRQSLVNGARRARLMDSVRDRMAFQEYQTIQEDLDGQVNAAFQKRNRMMKSKGKVKRPGAGAGVHGANRVGGGGAGGYGVARAGIGDVARMLMERRRKWQGCIRPVFDESINEIPADTIFEPDVMAGLMVQEKELWEEAEEQQQQQQ